MSLRRVWFLGVLVVAMGALLRGNHAVESGPAPQQGIKGTGVATIPNTATQDPSAGPSIGGHEEPGLRTVQLYGSKYVLVGSSRTDSVETEEYVQEGQTKDNWTQMLTYQRVVRPEPAAADSYAVALKRHLEQIPNAPRVRSVQQSKMAAILGAHYPEIQGRPEQFSLALVIVPDSRRPNEVHVVQYVAKPQLVPPSDLELEVKRWQARFQSQAASLGP